MGHLKMGKTENRNLIFFLAYMAVRMIVDELKLQRLHWKLHNPLILLDLWIHCDLKNDNPCKLMVVSDCFGGIAWIRIIIIRVLTHRCTTYNSVHNGCRSSRGVGGGGGLYFQGWIIIKKNICVERPLTLWLHVKFEFQIALHLLMSRSGHL